MSGKTAHGWSIQAHLMALTAAILLPGMLFSALVVWRYASAERASSEAAAQQQATALAVAVEREVAALKNMLDALAVAPSLNDDNLQAFHSFASAVAAKLNGTISLRNSESRILATTAVHWGDPLPAHSALSDQDSKAARTGRSVVSGVFMGNVDKRHLVALIIPVIRAGQLTYFLNISVPAARFTSALSSAGPGSAIIIDQQGAVVASSSQNGWLVGNRTVPASSGSVKVFDASVSIANWRIQLNVAEVDLAAPVNAVMSTVFALGFVLALLSIGAVLVISRRLVGPIHRLRADADMLGQNALVSPFTSSVLELNEVSGALACASDKIASASAVLQEVNVSLERQVESRTADLAQKNDELQTEMGRREKIEAQVRQMQKSEAIGQLTGGMAHDFNNMLAIILGSMRLLQRRVGDDPALRKYIDSAIEGAERAADLTRRLLAFARRQPLQPEVVAPNRLVQSMSEVLRRTIPEDCEIETVVAGGLWDINADKNQLESALVNLAVNARDAMHSGGKLTIETANVSLDEIYARQHLEVKPGQYVMIAVTDTGDGMSPEVMEHAFEPFFTTKPTGKGTGLGLSQVHGFVKQSGGHIKIYSELGQGTSVKLYFPRAKASDAVSHAAQAVPKLVIGNKTLLVLVVEDEPSVRAITVEMFQELGIRALQAENAKAALELIKKHPEIDLLFTDVVMPEMNGRVLADLALAERPNLKIVFATGYTRNAVVHNGVLDADVHLVVKPFSLETLSAKLREVLSSTEPPSP